MLGVDDEHVEQRLRVGELGVLLEVARFAALGRPDGVTASASRTSDTMNDTSASAASTITELPLERNSEASSSSSPTMIAITVATAANSMFAFESASWTSLRHSSSKRRTYSSTSGAEASGKVLIRGAASDTRIP